MSSAGSNNGDASSTDDWFLADQDHTANFDPLNTFNPEDGLLAMLNANTMSTESSVPVNGSRSPAREELAPFTESAPPDDYHEAPVRCNPTARDWAKHRDELIRLYVHDRLELKEIIAYMQQRYNFRASPRQYQERFRQWKARKNITDVVRREMDEQRRNGHLHLDPHQVRRLERQIRTYPDRRELSINARKYDDAYDVETAVSSLEKITVKTSDYQPGLASNALESLVSRRPMVIGSSLARTKDTQQTIEMPLSNSTEKIQSFYHGRNDQSNIRGHIADHPSSLNHDVTLFYDTLENIRRFYTLCMGGIEYARDVHYSCADNESSLQTGCDNKPETPDQRTPAKIVTHGKRRFDESKPIPEPNHGDDTVVATKRIKQREGSAAEFPCWWYVQNPRRYHTCANNCSRNRDLYSYRRHHFDEHWRWGDVESEGISFEVWNAAKHATHTRALTSPYAKDKSKWIHSYKILFGLSEADIVPDPICYTLDHIHLKPKRCIVRPLPSAQLTRNANKVLTDLGTSCTSSPVNLDSRHHSQTSFLPPLMAQPEPSFFPILDAAAMCDPTMGGFENQWMDRSDIASDLLEFKPQINDLNKIVSHHVSRISQLLRSMISSPHEVSCATIRQICSYAIDFETSYNHAIMTSSSSTQEPTNTGINGLSSSSIVAAATPADFGRPTAQTVDVSSFDNDGAHLWEPLRDLDNGGKTASQANHSDDFEKCLPGTPHQNACLLSTINRAEPDHHETNRMHDANLIDLSNWIFVQEDSSAEFGGNYFDPAAI